jgi:hypothetical protein
VDSNIDQIKIDLAELKPVERIKAIIELAKFLCTYFKSDRLYR